MARRVRISGDLQTRASFEPKTFDKERGTVEITFTTGARGKRNSWMDGPYYEELEVSEKAVDMSRLNNGAPYLNAHSSWSCNDVIGVVERAWLNGSEGRALIRFSEREDVKPIKADVENGILRHVSVGYSVQKMEKVEEIDGVPVYRVTRWTPAEISQVPMGFDDRAVVRGRPEQNSYEVEITEQEQKMPGTSNSTEGGNTPTPAPAAIPAPAPVAAPAQSTVVDEAARAAKEAELKKAAAEEAKVAERERVTTIRSLCTRQKLGEELANDLISKGVALDEARKVILEKLAERSDATRTEQHVRMGDTDGEKFSRVVEAAIYHRAGVVEMLESAKTKLVARDALASVSFDAGQFRAMDFVDIAREYLERSGVSTRGADKMTIVGRALTHRSGGMATASDFAILLANVTHKILLAAYATADDTWRSFCGIKSVGDFREHNLYRAGSFGTLDAVNEAGEYKSKAIPDGEKAAISVGSYGNIIAITRKALVNDDLGAFNDLAVKLGRAAALTIEAAVYTELAKNSGLGPTQTDGSPFFDGTARSNVGTGAALSVESIDSDAAVLAAQMDPSENEYLNLQPYALLVPRTLRGTANNINDSQYDPDANYKVQKPNMCKGMFKVVVATPRLSGTRRYMFADPALYPALAVTFLEGQQAPTVESKEGWRVDGTEMKVALDFGVAAIDFRAAITNAGAAGPG